MTTARDPLSHGLVEDAQAFLLGTTMCALGIQFLTYAGLITGQTAGLAVLLSYVSGWSFGVLFFALNLPFWALALARMGWVFTVRSAVAVVLLSVIAEVLPRFFVIDALPGWLAAILAGGCTGLGLIALFRHGASLGGVGVLALYLQDKAGIQAGWTQLAFDTVLFTAAVFVLDPWLTLWSLLGALIVNLIVAVNHRKDRYIAR